MIHGTIPNILLVFKGRYTPQHLLAYYGVQSNGCEQQTQPSEAGGKRLRRVIRRVECDSNRLIRRSSTRISVPFEHQHIRLAPSRRVYCHRQGLPIVGNTDLLRIYDLPADLVRQLYHPFVNPLRRRQSFLSRACVRIILAIELYVLRDSFCRRDNRKPVTFIPPHPHHVHCVHLFARAHPVGRKPRSPPLRSYT